MPRLIQVAKGSGPDEVLSAEQMRDYYHGIDYYLCASWNEGTPNPALEAAACGVPVVTTRVGNMRELIRHGENGYFIEPTADSIEQTLMAIKKLEADEYGEMCRAVRADIVENWTWKKNILNYIPPLEQLLATLDERETG